MPYRVVLFSESNSVECVPTSWICEGPKGEICFWPGGKDAKKKIRKQEIPDKDAWTSHRVRILGKREYEDFETATKHAKKSVDMDTSNPENYLESDEEDRGRPIRAPARFRLDESESEDEDIIHTYSSTPSTSSHKVLPIPMLQQDSSTPSTSSHKVLPIPMLQQDSSWSSTSSLTDELPVLQQVMEKLEKIERKVDILLGGETKPTADEVPLEDMLPGGQRINSLEALNTFEKGLESPDSKKNLIRVLSSLTSSGDLAKCCRYLMRALLTNEIMSKFSSRGQKGKLCFTERLLCRVLIATFKKMSKGHKTSGIIFEIGEVLRNAPNQPGGINYQKKHGQKSTKKSLQDSGLDLQVALDLE